jgi:hypothetical protein
MTHREKEKNKPAVMVLASLELAFFEQNGVSTEVPFFAAHF